VACRIHGISYRIPLGSMLIVIGNKNWNAKLETMLEGFGG
jgi:hypothetical protein